MNSPALIIECERALPALKAQATRAASEAQVREIVGRRFAVFPQPARSDSEWAMWWADYYAALDGITAPALEAAMAAWVRRPDSMFMPKPGELRQMAMTTPNGAAAMYERAKAATEAANAQPRLGPPMADRERVKRMLADFQAKMASREPRNARAPLPATHGKTDETGITPQMREVLQRREQAQ